MDQSDAGSWRLAPRGDRLDELRHRSFDLLVIGGGITGAGIALDLSLRGLQVLLIERDDWAAGTSGASSRLVHGGLRYLEHLQFGSVRHSCRERALLLKNAAGLVWPERFVFPSTRGSRVGPWRLRFGLWLYSALAFPRSLGWPERIGSAQLLELIPGLAAQSLRSAGAYLDGATNDSRLTLAVVLSAARAGATVLSGVEALAIENGSFGVAVQLKEQAANRPQTLRFRAAVLAAGANTDELRVRAGLSDDWIAPTRGTHLLLPRDRLPTDGAVIFASAVDGRIAFLIPWPRYTVIGTTDVDADPSQPVRATRSEVGYLLESANALVPGARLGEQDVISTYAGLRPLLVDDPLQPSARSREERIERAGSIYVIAGGKLTGYRQMAEQLSARLTSELGLGALGLRSRTREHRLVYAERQPTCRPQWSTLGELPPDVYLAAAWQQRYGSSREIVRQRLSELSQGLQLLDPETCLGEVDWAVEREDCRTPADFLLRRTGAGRNALEAVQPIATRVIDRMAAHLDWNRSRRDQLTAEWQARLAALHAWREEPT